MKTKKGMDIFNTPIFICRKDERAVVIYKNRTARDRMRYPTHDNGMYKHIDRYYIDDYKEIIKGGKPKVIALTLKNVLTKALVGNYAYNGEDVTIWIFLDMLQIESYNSFFGYILERDEQVFSDIIELIDLFGTGDNAVSIMKDDTRIFKIRQALSSVVNKLFATPSLHKHKIYNLNKTFDDIVSQCERLMAKMGYRFSVVTDRIAESNNLYMHDIGIFMAIYVHIMVLGFSLSYNKEGFVEFYTDSRHIIIELNFTLKNPKYYINNSSDTDLLIKTFPEECFNMMLLDQYVKYKFWDCKFDITDQERNNFRLRVYADLIDDYVSMFRTDPLQDTEFDNSKDEIMDLFNTLLQIHFGK